MKPQKVKFKHIMNRVSEREREGLAEYHKHNGGHAALKLLSLRDKFYNLRV